MSTGTSAPSKRNNHNHIDPADDAVLWDTEAYFQFLDAGYDEDAAYNAALHYGGYTHHSGTADYRPGPDDTDDSVEYHNKRTPDYNIGTHYYGDQCPGGHYDEPHIPDHNC